MNIAQIEENVKTLLANLASGQCKQDDFIYELLLAYGHRKQSVSRLRSGERNLAIKGKGAGVEVSHNEIIWKRHLYYKTVDGDSLLSEIDQMRKEKLVSTNKIRFIIVTDFDHLFAHDLKTNDRLDISLSELPNKFDFFLPWAGMEKAVYQGENPADVKAAEKMAKLFDLIKDDNFDESNKDDTEALHGLNVFLTRLLFCFFAEDTEIFKDNQFSNAIQSHTKDDGSDLSDYLNRLFLVLNTADRDRAQLPNAPLPEYLDNFPYVNGGLFADDIPSPTFSAKSRRMLIECGSQLDWSDINPDIFGSMIQAVVHPDQRGGMGMHYTSVTNIMKVIEPLFLNDLYEELEKFENSATKLQKLQQRLGEIKIFDPACGSGNFLIIAYKELRKLEMEVLKRLQEIELEKSGQISQPFSVIKLSQFYGIELDDFAHEVAILSLWLAEHQMNIEFKSEFGYVQPSLPLKASGNIVSGNSIRVNWLEFCPRSETTEVFILGNPPYLGARMQTVVHKSDIEFVYKGRKGSNSLDYICCWFEKASEYVKGSIAKFAFVSTNSVVQGEQVALLWQDILNKGQEIFFAHLPFKWQNSAKRNAAVICVIVGIRNIVNSKKFIYSETSVLKVKNINPYLSAGKSVFVHRKNKPLSALPLMSVGNMPIDGGNLILELSEYEAVDKIIKESGFLYKFIGSQEFLQGKRRWAIWIDDDQLERASEIDYIKDRIKKTKEFRLKSLREATKELADVPHKFGYISRRPGDMIIVPKVSSERRKFIPIGYVDESCVVSDLVFCIYNAEPWVLAILSSTMHMSWVRAVAGRLKSDFRYSSAICYNTFPIPLLSDDKISILNNKAVALMLARENYPGLTLAKMYDLEKMPQEIIDAHAEIDEVVDGLYKPAQIKDDTERLALLFNMYADLTGETYA
jgi:hypothetical protein